MPIFSTNNTAMGPFLHRARELVKPALKGEVWLNISPDSLQIRNKGYFNMILHIKNNSGHYLNY